jgi:UDPglucose--hexose-1-phosphate uridylyltransferase
VRVVPNLYPALSGDLGRQEVVVHGPRHVASVAELSPPELHDIAAAWQARAAAARSEGFRYVHAFVNEGRAAGASLAHSHSQLAWLTERPPATAWEWTHSDGAGPCRVCQVLREEGAAKTRVVAERGGLVAVSPYGAWAPYVVRIAPKRCEADGLASRRLSAALALLADVIRALRSLEGHVPLNAWLHTSELDTKEGHWHFELEPRLTIRAGLELGAGIYVNTVAPEAAAATLRDRMRSGA